MTQSSSTPLEKSCYDYKFIVNNAKIAVDTRNATGSIMNKSKSVKA